jgi:hypothetical protein
VLSAKGSESGNGILREQWAPPVLGFLKPAGPERAQSEGNDVDKIVDREVDPMRIVKYSFPKLILQSTKYIIQRPSKILHPTPLHLQLRDKLD